MKSMSFKYLKKKKNILKRKNGYKIFCSAFVWPQPKLLFIFYLMLTFGNLFCKKTIDVCHEK